MGVHQYQLEPLPRSFFKQQIPSALSETDIEFGQEDPASGWWAKTPPSQKMLSQLRELLPVDASWGEVEEFRSKSEFGSDLRIWKNGKKVCHITFRFSTVENDSNLMRKFLSIVQSERCLLLETKTGVLFEPDEQIVQNRLNISTAARFTRDPVNTLVQASKKMQD